MTTIENPKAVLELLQSRFQPQRAGNMSGIFQFDITGEGGGRWYVTIKDKTMEVSEGTHPAPNATVVLSAEDWARLAKSPYMAESLYSSGRLQVRGNLDLVERLQYLFS